MKKEKAPMKGREDCAAGAHDYTATRQNQSRAIQPPRLLQNGKIRIRSTDRAMQRARLLHWLQAHQQITTLQARNELGIMHPAGRIKELRESGNDIATYWQWDADATGKEHKQALYVLLSVNGGVVA